MNLEKNERQNRARERVEAQLRAAADFEPTERAPVGFAARALARQPACRSHRRTAFVLGTGVATTALALLAAWTMHGPNANRVSIPSASPSKNAEAERGPDIQPSGKGEEQSYKMPHVQLVKQTQPERERDDRENVRPKRRHWRHYRVAGPPKVRWHDETVAEYRSGVITPAWVVQRDDENGVVVATPVMVDIPMQSGEIPLANGAPGAMQLSLVNYSQETQENP